MTFNSLLLFGGAGFSAILAVVMLLGRWRSFAHRAFAVGMLVFAAEGVFAGLSLQAVFPDDVNHWQHLRMVATSLLPCCWLLFSLSYARADFGSTIARWRWGAVAASIVPFVLATLLGGYLFQGPAFQLVPPAWTILLGWSGYVFHIAFLVAAVLVVANLERTLRASSGALRGRNKYMLLGVGVVFAARIYTTSQVLLFAAVDTRLETISGGALVLGCMLVLVHVIRSGLQSGEIYISQQMLFRSSTILISGLYLLLVGLVGKGLRRFDPSFGVTLETSFLSFGLLVLAACLLSERLRYRTKRFIRRHFQQARHDYRKVWSTFTERTSFWTDIRDLGAAVVKTISETFGVPSVSIWLLDETQNRPLLLGSTALSASDTETIGELEKEVAFLMISIRDRDFPVDLDRSEWGRSQGYDSAGAEYPASHHIRYGVPLAVGRDFLGIITLDEPSTGEPLSIEDLDLLRTISDQTAGAILNHRLFERLAKAKEMEAFQTLSAFFVHDLKNLASTLSLTLQNLPVHFDNPEFREDTLRLISRSVDRIKDMCGQLSQLDGKLELRLREADLNELVATTLDTLNGTLHATLNRDLRPIPKVPLDSEQMQKVLLNLVLNAGEASPEGGDIRVTTSQEGKTVVLAVSDEGSGMSREFMERSLFHPFKTTKKRGLGIGLYHSKMIVEAHRGRIEVLSEEGRGSTFRVVLLWA